MHLSRRLRRPRFRKLSMRHSSTDSATPITMDRYGVTLNLRPGADSTCSRTLQSTIAMKDIH